MKGTSPSRACGEAETARESGAKIEIAVNIISQARGGRHGQNYHNRYGRFVIVKLPYPKLRRWAGFRPFATFSLGTGS
jgi:hypothetical protein